MAFNDKIIIVTGASTGIGAATAIKFAEEKAKVVIVARTEAKLKEVSEKCKEHGAEPLMIVADVTKDSDIKNIISTTIYKCGRIDVLVNNAGVAGPVAIWDDKAIDVFDRVMNTNLRSVVYLTNLAAPHLIETKGNIINVSSVAALDVSLKQHFSYCTSKAGLDHFTRSAALDFASKGVRVNTVNPGPVETNFVSSLGLNKEQQAQFWIKIAETTALRRVSAPEEVADLILFLASEKAKAITGSSVVVDNGRLLKRNINIE